MEFCSWEMEADTKVNLSMGRLTVRERESIQMELYTKGISNKEKNMATERSPMGRLVKMNGTRESGSSMWDKAKEPYLQKKKILLQYRLWSHIYITFV